MLQLSPKLFFAVTAAVLAGIAGTAVAAGDQYLYRRPVGHIVTQDTWPPFSGDSAIDPTKPWEVTIFLPRIGGLDVAPHLPKGRPITVSLVGSSAGLMAPESPYLLPSEGAAITNGDYKLADAKSVTVSLADVPPTLCALEHTSWGDLWGGGVSAIYSSSTGNCLDAASDYGLDQGYVQPIYALAGGGAGVSFPSSFGTSNPRQDSPSLLSESLRALAPRVSCTNAGGTPQDISVQSRYDSGLWGGGVASSRCTFPGGSTGLIGASGAGYPGSEGILYTDVDPDGNVVLLGWSGYPGSVFVDTLSGVTEISNTFNPPFKNTVESLYRYVALLNGRVFPGFGKSPDTSPCESGDPNLSCWAGGEGMVAITYTVDSAICSPVPTSDGTRYRLLDVVRDPTTGGYISCASSLVPAGTFSSPIPIELPLGATTNPPKSDVCVTYGGVSSKDRRSACVSYISSLSSDTTQYTYLYSGVVEYGGADRWACVAHAAPKSVGDRSYTGDAVPRPGGRAIFYESQAPDPNNCDI